jgi:hypothetical protein
LKKFLLALAVAATCALSLRVVAHHSGAMFDHTKTIAVHGTLKEFQYTNPHSWLMVMVVSANGSTVEWGFETEGPSTLMRAGIKPKSFRPGDELTVTANPMRDGRPAGSLISVTTADGTVYTVHP